MAQDAAYWDWRTKGACAQLNFSEAEKMFFPTNGRTIKKAKAFCETQCEVYQKCLAWATHPDQAKEKGIIAGLSEKDRRAISKINSPGKTNSGSFKKKSTKKNFVFS